MSGSFSYQGKLTINYGKKGSPCPVAVSLSLVDSMLSHSFSNFLSSNHLSFVSLFTQKRCKASRKKALETSQNRSSISTSHSLSGPES